MLNELKKAPTLGFVSRLQRCAAIAQQIASLEAALKRTAAESEALETEAASDAEALGKLHKSCSNCAGGAATLVAQLQAELQRLRSVLQASTFPLFFHPSLKVPSVIFRCLYTIMQSELQVSHASSPW